MYGTFFLSWNSSPLSAHPSEDMDAVRLAVYRWALALSQRDVEGISALLADDMTDSAGNDRRESLATLETLLGRHTVDEVLVEETLYNRTEGQVEAAPIFLSLAERTMKKAMGLILSRRETGWKIVHLEWLNPNAVVWPSKWRDVDLPEQHQLFPVRVRVEDKDSGTPVASRIRILDGKSRYWPPAGHQKNIRVGWRQDVGGDVVIDGKSYAYVEPEFEVLLPPGDYTIELARGIEYLPSTADFRVKSETMAPLSLQLERWANMSSAGWYSGDTHVHFLSPHSAWLEARAEDVNVVNVLATKWGELITNVEHFLGRPDPVSDPNHIIYVNEESRHRFLGHTVLLNLKHLVYPLSWGEPGAGVPGGVDSPSMARQADLAHAQGGLVGWAHFPYPSGELAVDVALGKIDSFDLFTWGDPFVPFGPLGAPVKVWYRFLNAGFDIPVTAGTDKMWNRQVVGNPRTYVKIDGSFCYDGWTDGIRRGRTFVTTGPLVQLEVNGRLPGDSIQLKTPGEVEASATLRSRLPVDRLELVQDGRVIATLENSSRQLELTLKASASITASSWIAARAYSTTRLPYQDVYDANPLMAHTSPIYVQVDGQDRSSKVDAEMLQSDVEKALSWLENEANIPDRKEFETIHRLFEQAREIYLSRAGSH